MRKSPRQPEDPDKARRKRLQVKRNRHNQAVLHTRATLEERRAGRALDKQFPAKKRRVADLDAELEESSHLGRGPRAADRRGDRLNRRT